MKFLSFCAAHRTWFLILLIPLILWGTIQGIITLTGSAPADTGDDLWHMAMNLVGLIVAWIIIDFVRSKGHLLYDAPEDGDWKLQLVEGLCTVLALFVSLWFLRG